MLSELRYSAWSLSLSLEVHILGPPHAFRNTSKLISVRHQHSLRLNGINDPKGHVLYSRKSSKNRVALVSTCSPPRLKMGHKPIQSLLIQSLRRVSELQQTLGAHPRSAAKHCNRVAVHHPRQLGLARISPHYQVSEARADGGRWCWGGGGGLDNDASRIEHWESGEGPGKFV